MKRVLGPGNIFLIKKEGVYAKKFPYFGESNLITSLNPKKHNLEVYDPDFGVKGYLE